MKKKRYLFAILAVLIVFTTSPLISVAAGSQPGFTDTQVIAAVAPVYQFSLPPNITVRYPNTSILIGQFGVRDLLLHEGEQLSIELVAGTMAARERGAALPYSVTFNPPATVDAANIGQSYDVVVTIGAAAFAATRRPYHDANLLFRVRSSLNGEIIWQGTTTVTARRVVSNGGGGNNGGDNGGQWKRDSGYRDNTIPGEEVPQNGGTPEDNNGQPGVVIPGEDIPEGAACRSGFLVVDTCGCVGIGAVAAALTVA